MFVDSRSIGVTSEAKCGKWKRIFGGGSFLSTVVRSEVAGRSAGIDWRRGFAPIDRSISVDSRTIFSSLIQLLLSIFGRAFWLWEAHFEILGVRMYENHRANEWYFSPPCKKSDKVPEQLRELVGTIVPTLSA